MRVAGLWAALASVSLAGSAMGCASEPKAAAMTPAAEPPPLPPPDPLPETAFDEPPSAPAAPTGGRARLSEVVTLGEDPTPFTRPPTFGFVDTSNIPEQGAYYPHVGGGSHALHGAGARRGGFGGGNGAVGGTGHGGRGGRGGRGGGHR
jgi:hypothetical protein